MIIVFVSCSNSEACGKYEDSAITTDSIAIVYQNLGVRALLDFEKDSAMYHFKKAIDRDKSYYLPHVSLANIYIQQNQYDLALIEFETAAKLEPNLAEAQGGLATLYDYLEKTEEAKETYALAIELYSERLSCEKDEEAKKYIRLNRAFLFSLSGEEEEGMAELASLKNEFNEDPFTLEMINDFLSTDHDTFLQNAYGTIYLH